LGTGFYRFPITTGLPYTIGLTFYDYLVMLILSSLYHLSPHLLTIVARVLPPSLLLMTTRRFSPPLGPFRRSKPPYEPMLNLNMLLFVTLSKSYMMSSVGWQPSKISIFRTLGLALRHGEIRISLKVVHRTLLPILSSDCFLVLPFPFLHMFLH